MFLKLRLYSIILATVLIFSGCDEEKNTPSELIFGLNSHSNIENVKLKIKSGKWDLVEKNQLSQSDNRPPYEYIRISTNYFKDAGFSGKTILNFYNGGLMSVWFYPNDWPKYLEYLSKKWGKALKGEKWEIIKDNVRIWTAVDYYEKRYVAWEDITIAKKMELWLKKHS